ncbi:MAG TPA: hypothetical protein VHY75_09830 [Steroidobacteraceae bacterium]|jgi:hypothetical protein|nr:hypothetical protein [Steroidobacteraceae bacterium]
MNMKLVIASIFAAAALLCACQRKPPGPPSPQSRQQETSEATRKAASAEAEMNKDSQSEDISKGAAPDNKKQDEEGQASSPPR